jgi:hypothetical protein
MAKIKQRKKQRTAGTMTISYKKETPLEKHLHEFRDHNFKIQVERMNTNNAKVYFLESTSDKIIEIPKNITCYNLTGRQFESSFNINGLDCFLVTWTDSYNFYCDNEKFFSLYNQKQQQEKNQNRIK